jgi:AcrR family transcriptional regulator
MQRVRTAVLDATAHCVERYGVRRTTMGDIALKAAIAKGTLYNHFRAKDDVLAALVEDRVAALATDAAAVAAEEGLAPALQLAADALASSGPLRRLAADEPATAARLLAPGEGRAWQGARAAVGSVLRAAGADAPDDAVDVVLRWLLSQVFWPQPTGDADREAARLAAAVAAPA